MIETSIPHLVSEKISPRSQARIISGIKAFYKYLKMLDFDFYFYEKIKTESK